MIVKCFILMVMVKGEEMDQLIGFLIGVDDYVVKFFSIKVFLECIKVLCCCCLDEVVNNGDVVDYKGIMIDWVCYCVICDGIVVDLMFSEFCFLEMFICQFG